MNRCEQGTTFSFEGAKIGINPLESRFIWPIIKVFHFKQKTRNIRLVVQWIFRENGEGLKLFSL